MIRPLIPDEVPLLLPLAREFFAEGNICGKLNEKHWVSTLQENMRAGRMFVLGEDMRGYIAGTMFQDLATAEMCCMEYFWFVGKHERGSLGIKLLAAFETESFRRGAVRVLMMHLVTDESAKFENLYARRSYRLRERVYMKEKV